MTSSKQTRSFKHARKEIKTIQCSNFLNAIFMCFAESISQINIFWRMLPHIFYELYNSRSLAMQGFARCYYLISKRKQFGQISKLQGKQ